MHECFDFNKSELTIGCGVMVIDGGNESEGVVVELYDDNKVMVECETDSITVDGSDCFVLPNFM